MKLEVQSQIFIETKIKICYVEMRDLKSTMGFMRLNSMAVNFANGVYFYKLQSGGFVHTRETVLLK
jgi:hypothetical protein